MKLENAVKSGVIYTMCACRKDRTRVFELIAHVFIYVNFITKYFG